MKVGVLALQGAFREHAEVFDALGADVTLVRLPEHLAGVDALVIPGGESTAIEKLLDSSGLREPVADLVREGRPTLATCAGLIVLAREISDGRPDQRPLGLLDCTVRRNGYGRQVDSFEAPLAITGIVGGPFPGVFIRAPIVERAGAAVEVLASHEDRPVLCRQGTIWAATFHPELSGDLRVHERFLQG
jgi:pyridoxal 5''-phosphate synthase, glutaminase subunit Pdx2